MIAIAKSEPKRNQSARFGSIACIGMCPTGGGIDSANASCGIAWSCIAPIDFSRAAGAAANDA